jgi:hypothetical protein
MSPIFYKPPSDSVPVATQTPDLPSRDLSLDSLAKRRRDSDEEIITKKIRLPEAMWPFEPPAPMEAASPPPPEPPPPPPPPPAEPSGRTLADLYFEQKHYPEALAIYLELLAAAPNDEELVGLRADAERLAASNPPPELPPADPARERRLEKIRVLNEWLSAVRAAAAADSDGRVR